MSAINVISALSFGLFGALKYYPVKRLVESYGINRPVSHIRHIHVNIIIPDYPGGGGGGGKIKKI